MLSVIIPAYNEETMIPITAETLTKVLDEAEIPFELLFIDDGSRDRTWEEICCARDRDARVCGIRFSRNFGKEAAMFAGLEKASGDCCVVIDCDLQHPPEKIIEMYRLWEDGYEVVEGIKEDRGEESGFHRFAAGSFYGLISRATGMDMAASSDFKLLDRKVVDTLNAMPERNVFFRALSFWVGFRRAEVHYDVRERVAGESKWSTRSLVRYAINNIGSFSSAPLQIVTVLGIITFVFSLIFSLVTLIQKITGQALGGFTTVIILMSFIGSIIMLSLGIIGYYV
ncbi:MAG: glycosyltransferase family 2 protein, partial [Oscillospiraceae bacterium]|nr:glycosyltransferase family 2 protein [Oscillospiraceae bacterium]